MPSSRRVYKLLALFDLHNEETSVLRTNPFLIGNRAFSVVSVQEKILLGVHFFGGSVLRVTFCHRTLSDEEATAEES